MAIASKLTSIGVIALSLVIGFLSFYLWKQWDGSYVSIMEMKQGLRPHGS